MWCRNPAHLEVRPYALYLYLFYSLCNSSHFYVIIYRPYLSRHRSESSRTSSYALILCRRYNSSPRWSLPGSWFQLPLQYLCIPAKSIWAGHELYHVGSLGTPLHLASEVRLGCRYPAHLEVNRTHYICIYSIRYVVLHIFIYVPVTGRISPGTDRNQVGPLPMHSFSAGGSIRARGGHFQGRGTTFRCKTSALKSRASGRDPTCTA